MKAGLRCCLAMILIQCLVFGRAKKIFEPSPRLLALLYDIIMNTIFCNFEFGLHFGIFLTKFNSLQSLKLLSVMAAIRLDDDDTDNIEKTLAVALVDSSSSAVNDRSITMVDPLASSTWEQVNFCCC